MRARRWPRPYCDPLFLLWLAVAAGCSRPAQPNANEAGAVDAARVLAEAPADLTALLAWAAPYVQQEPEAVPIPPAVTPNPRWHVVRLDDPTRLHSAQHVSQWKASSGGAGALAKLGPFRSDRPGPSFTVRRSSKVNPDGDDALVLLMSGFRVNRNEVGSVELTLSVPFGQHVVLTWSKAGVVLIPVESHEEPFTVRLLTDDFAEWSGPLKRLGLTTDGFAERVVEIRELRFLPREHSYPQPVGVKRARLGHETRTAIYAHCPSAITFENVVVPQNGKLHVGLGCIAGTPAAAAVDFSIAVTVNEKVETVLERRIPRSDSWRDTFADMSRWAGQSVALELKSAAPTSNAVALWGNPIIYEPIADPPVMVLYLIDTLAAEHMNLHGFERETTPRLTEAAKNGVWFSKAYANSSRTIESIPDMMLSLYTEQHGVHHISIPAAARFVTLAEALCSAGMATVSFCTNVNAGPRQGMAQGFDTFVDKIGYHWTNVDRTVPLEEVEQWIGQHADRPMFLYIHTAEPHAPYTPPTGFADRFDADYTGQIDGTYDRVRGFRTIRKSPARSRDLKHVSALYDEEILYSDARFGMTLELFARLGLADRMHMLVTSDHGEEFLEHGMWEHGTDLHNEQTRVPLIAFGPSFGRGIRRDEPVQIVDIMPTILDALELPQPYTLVGDSLLPLIRDEAARLPADRLLFASNYHYRLHDRNPMIEFSVIEGGRWKLLCGWRKVRVHPGGPKTHFKLYDLTADPRERRNLIADHPDVARRLMEHLIRWRLTRPPYETGETGPTQIDPDHMQKLIELGYVG